MCLVYGLNYLDSKKASVRNTYKNNTCSPSVETTLSYASIMGLQDDLKLKGDNYQWLGSMFYFGNNPTSYTRILDVSLTKSKGYIGWEFPTNWIMQRLPLAKYTSFNVIMWGLVLSLFAVTENFGGGVAIRFFLGFFEAAVTPGFALMTSQVSLKPLGCTQSPRSES